MLDQYCERKKINFHVALNSKRLDKKFKIDFNEEIKFIKKFSKNYVIKNLSSYELAAQSKITVCMNSNLGYELFARKKRVLFLNLDKALTGDKRQCLYDSEINSDFMITTNDKSFILKKLEEIMMMSDVEWMRIFNNSSLKMPFDEGNTLLKNNIKNILN